MITPFADNTCQVDRYRTVLSGARHRLLPQDHVWQKWMSGPGLPGPLVPTYYGRPESRANSKFISQMRVGKSDHISLRSWFGFSDTFSSRNVYCDLNQYMCSVNTFQLAYNKIRKKEKHSVISRKGNRQRKLEINKELETILRAVVAVPAIISLIPKVSSPNLGIGAGSKNPGVRVGLYVPHVNPYPHRQVAGRVGR